MRPSYEEFVAAIETNFSEKNEAPFHRIKREPETSISPYRKWREFTYAYSVAANLIAKELYENPNRDFLSLPLLFLYRQYAELEMKSFLQFRANFVEVHEKIGRTHDLSWLWKLCSEELTERGFLEFDSSFEVIRKTMDYICEHDPRGDLFRYPEAGVPREYSSLSLDLEMLLRGMRELDLIFDYYTNVFGV